MVHAGEEMISEVTNKANKIHEDLQTQNLIQSSSELFGVSEDETINPDAIATQITSALSGLATPSNPLTQEEKNVLHSLIRGFAQVFSPNPQESTSDFQEMAKDMSEKVGQHAGKHDNLLEPQTLLGVFTSGDESGINTKLITDLAESFLSTFEKQFDKASNDFKLPSNEKKD